MFTAFHDGSNESQIAERIFINQGRQLLFRTGLNKVQLDKDFRQASSPRAGISLDASGNILPHVSEVRGTVGPILHLSSLVYHTFSEQRTQKAGIMVPPPVPGVNRAARYHRVRLCQLGRSKRASPPAGNSLGVPELQNFCAAGAETALANSIVSPNDAEQLWADEVQDAGGQPDRAIHYAKGEQIWSMN